MSEALTKIQALTESFSQKKAELVEKLQANFFDLFKETFEKCPNVRTLSWTQYVPYFNDGDECVFDVYMYFYDSINEDDESDDKGMITPTEDEKLLILDLQTELEKIDKEIYRDVFGNHVKVIVSRDGTIRTDYYAHD